MDFFRTVMGHRFIEHTMPELVRQLARLNANLEAILNQLGPGDRTPEDQERR